MIKRVGAALCLIIFMSACSSNNNSLETRDEIDFETISNEQQSFIYNMYWYVPLSSQRYRRDQSLLAIIGIGNRQPVAVDNENKLKLEDLAVRKLTGKLKENGRCSKGHEIESTLWFDRSIQLTGKCW